MPAVVTARNIPGIQNNSATGLHSLWVNSHTCKADVSLLCQYILFFSHFNVL